MHLVINMEQNVLHSKSNNDFETYCSIKNKRQHLNSNFCVVNQDENGTSYFFLSTSSTANHSLQLTRDTC